MSADGTATASVPTSSSGGGGGLNPTYTITINEPAYGTLTASVKQAVEGATITIRITPDDGYKLDTLLIQNAKVDPIRYSTIDMGQYIFTMPARYVVISANFIAEKEPETKNHFTDIYEEDWFYDAVLYVYDHDVMQGVGNQRFEPNQKLTRAMVAQILYNIEGSPSVSEHKIFQDVSTDAWYAPAVLWAANHSIVLGYDTGLFEPDTNISHEQLATFLYRYAEFKGLDVSVKGDLSSCRDSASISPWAKDAVSWANASGLLIGMETDTLNPLGTASRAEAATLLMRYIEDISK